MGRYVFSSPPSPRDATSWDRDLSGPDNFAKSLLSNPELNLGATSLRASLVMGENNYFQFSFRFFQILPTEVISDAQLGKLGEDGETSRDNVRKEKGSLLGEALV